MSNIEQFMYRTFQPESDDLTVEEAKRILAVRFDERDLNRMHELADKNQRKGLSSDEEDELRVYRTVGLMFDILRAKARLALERAGEAEDDAG